jgi:hypothetical protein
MPVLAAMIGTMGGTAFAVSAFASSPLPRSILSVEDRFFAKALAMVEAVVVLKGKGENE